MKLKLLCLFVALFATCANCQYPGYPYVNPDSQAPPQREWKTPSGVWNVQQSYENYNNQENNPGKQYPGFSTDPFYNPNFSKDPSVPEKKTYQNYNMDASYHVSSKDDPTLVKDPFKSFEGSVEVSHFKNQKSYSYGKPV